LKTLPGELVVWKNDVEIARHGAGDYLGETALIESKPRSEKAVASEPTYLLEITHDLFNSQLSSYPDALLAIMKMLSNRARENLKIFDRNGSQKDGLDIHKGDSALETQICFLMQDVSLT
jgi:CRP-like cAMP-binding protein